MEAKANKTFKKYKLKLIKEFGRKALDNTEIDSAAQTMFGKKYRGSYAQDEKFEKKTGYYIINTDISTGPGIHWISCKITPKTIYIYDSFGRDSKKILPHLVKYLYPRKIVESKNDKEQKDAEVICGHLSLSFLAVAYELGIKAAILI